MACTALPRSSLGNPITAQERTPGNASIAPSTSALLTAFFLERFRGRLNKRIDRIDTETLERLKSYSWPGNIRELANVVERAMIASSGRTLVVEELLANPGRPTETLDSPPPSGPPLPLADVERSYIRSVCERCGWRIRGDGGAARILGLNPSTLRSRMKKLGIVHPQTTIGALSLAASHGQLVKPTSLPQHALPRCS